MRMVFSEKERRVAWRKVWLALAEAQSELGLVSKGELRSIRSKSGREHIDIAKAHALERKIKHELMAELHVFAEQAKAGGGKLHLGATSMDIEDNADVLLYNDAVEIILSRLVRCLDAVREKIIRYRGVVCIAWTHLQPAEPTALGYRFANYAQDLVLDLKLLALVRAEFLRGKGVTGAVGTSASFKVLLGSEERVRKLEDSLQGKLGIEFFELSTQTYPRKVDYLLLACLTSIAQSCHKFGLDLRIMQSPAFGELSEPIGEYQVGSSAMPFKKNPTRAERMCSLARVVPALQVPGFTNAANTILERTLDDSAARRIMMPEAFLAIDECLALYEELFRGLRVYPSMVRRNLERYGQFAGTEAILMKLVQKGEDRQAAHERIRVLSFKAWDEVMKGRPNPLARLLAQDKVVAAKLSEEEIGRLLDPIGHTGDAREKCERFVARTIDPILSSHRLGKAQRRKSY